MTLPHAMVRVLLIEQLCAHGRSMRAIRTTASEMVASHTQNPAL